MANYISRRRRELGITQEELADRCKVTSRTVRAWEAGGKVKITHLRPLAEALKTTTQKLVKEEGR